MPTLRTGGPRASRIPGAAWAVACGVLLALAALPARADLTAQALPGRLSLVLKPGETVARDVIVSNAGENTVIVHVRYADWTVDEWGNVAFLPASALAASLGGCVRFDPNEFSLEPGESGRVQIEVTMPETGPPTRWGVLLSEVRPARPAKTTGPRAIAELGTTIYASRVSAAAPRLELEELRALPFAGDSIEIGFRIRNEGGRHCYPGGELALRDSSGLTLATSTLAGGVLLPGGARRYRSVVPAPRVPGRYGIVATIDLGEPELLVGEAELPWPPAAEPPWIVEHR